MTLKQVQEKLRVLRDRIRNQGEISADDEKELKSLIRETLKGANTELEDLQGRLTKVAHKQCNDNSMSLNEDQQFRLSITEKAGVGSTAVH